MSFNLTTEEILSFQVPKTHYLPKVVIENPGFTDFFTKLITQLEDLKSADTCEKRAARFKLPVVNSAYAEKIISQEDNRFVILGIRFQNLNPELPFVSFNLNYTPTEKELQELGLLARQHFPEFNLKGYTLRLSANLDFQLAHDKWNHTLWAELADASKTETPPQGFVWNDQVDFYPLYFQKYSRFAVNNPRLEEFLSLEGEQNLQKAAKEKLLLSFYDDRGWCGVIAGEEKKYYGYSCLYITEKFLCERARGKGWAKNFERVFLNKMAERYDHVYGHIVNANAASLKTAISVGRKPIETEYFFSLA